MSDITQIKTALSSHALEIAQMLLPGGKREGNEYRAGSVSGGAGHSLGVHLTGAKAGVWSDFATGEGGDLLDLWCKSVGIDLVEAISRARDYLGIERPKFTRAMQNTPHLKPLKPKCSKPDGEVREYLRNERKLSDEAIDAYRFGATPDGRVVFPFMERDGKNPAMIKTRGMRDKDCKPTSKSQKKTLLGWHLVTPNDRTCVIVEGEYDAPSGYDYGFRPCLSVPFGGGAGAKQDWIENDYDNMEQFETIYLALDDDPTGDEACEEIAQRLGRHRCRRVKLPRKDFNQCLVDGVPPEEIVNAFAAADDMKPEGLRRPMDYEAEVNDLFWPADGQPPGYYLPYTKIGHRVMFRKGELTLWGGATSEGKSQFLSDCSTDFVNQGSRICIASLEMHPKYQLKRMVKQVGNVDRPTREYLGQCLEWLQDGVYLYDAVGKRDVDTILSVFDYARARYGCDQFIIDSLMRLGIKADDYVAQDAAIFKMVNWAIENDVHVHLVVHTRKRERGGAQPTIEDVKGASEITNNAFNVLLIWRNRQAEQLIEASKGADNYQTVLAENPSVVVNVCKQRNGDWEGFLSLWFDKNTYRYSGSPTGEVARQYVWGGKKAEAA